MKKKKKNLEEDNGIKRIKPKAKQYKENYEAVASWR